MQSGIDFVTIVFICLAIFVVWKLRSVLGQKTGSEQPPPEISTRDKAEPRQDGWRNQSGGPRADNDQVITLPPRQQPPQEPLKDRWKGIAEPGTPLADTLDRIAGLEPSFNAREFLNGAKTAYEIIVSDFAKGDRSGLKDLLTPDVYAGFEQALSERESRGEKVETTFVSIDKSELDHADLIGRDARLTVRFVSKLISVTRDASGKVVDGSPDSVSDVSDVWTFARTLGTNDPTWHLAGTESGQ